MLKENDFVWKERTTNNIPTNPFECFYCIVDVGDCARLFSIEPQYPLDKDGMTLSNDEPEFYILFENIAKKATTIDKDDFFYEESHYSGYIFSGNKGFVRAFKTLEEAKRQAFKQYSAIYGFVLSHIVDDVNIATKKHFVVK